MTFTCVLTGGKGLGGKRGRVFSPQKVSSAAPPDSRRKGFAYRRGKNAKSACGLLGVRWDEVKTALLQKEELRGILRLDVLQ